MVGANGGGAASGGPASAGAPLRVLIVDDHNLFRSGLAMLLAEHGVEVVGEAPTAEEGLRLAEVRAPEVVVMDLGLPRMSGLEATRLLHERDPSIAILVLTASLDEQDVVDALIGGASGYLLKDAPIEQILSALQAARAGDSVISPRLNRKLVERLRSTRSEDDGDGRSVELSEREREILRLLVAGEDNAEIAGQLYLSPSTVKNQVSTILQKLGVDNRVQAAVQAVRAGLVDP